MMTGDPSELRPVFVLGAPHSGTTILYRMLALHSDVAWLSQYSQRSGRIPGRFRLPLGHVVDRLRRAAALHDWRKWQHGILGMIMPRPSDASSLWGYLLSDQPGRSGADQVALVRRVIVDESRRWHRRRFIAKFAQWRINLPVLRAAFPQAAFVHIVRDGRAVAFSLREKFLRRGLSPRDSLTAAAAAWCEAVDGIERGIASATHGVVRYEALCDDVHGWLRVAMASAGLPADRFPFERVPTHLQVSNSRRLEGLVPEELALVEALQGPYLRRFEFAQL